MRKHRGYHQLLWIIRSEFLTMKSQVIPKQLKRTIGSHQLEHDKLRKGTTIAI
ncbi:MAG: hypothetical protein ABFD60_09910 [Bryobacteraceae bacterium]